MKKKIVNKSIYLNKSNIDELKGQNIFLIRRGDCVVILTKENILSAKDKIGKMYQGKEREKKMKLFFSRIQKEKVAKKKIRLQSFLTKDL